METKKRTTLRAKQNRLPYLAGVDASEPHDKLTAELPDNKALGLFLFPQHEQTIDSLIADYETMYGH